MELVLSVLFLWSRKESITPFKHKSNRSLSRQNKIICMVPNSRMTLVFSADPKYFFLSKKKRPTLNFRDFRIFFHYRFQYRTNNYQSYTSWRPICLPVSRLASKMKNSSCPCYNTVRLSIKYL